ncbi:peptidylprolyl isomerase [Ferruginibacter yonginensis]|uniref:Peptidylprolyl isomerase n=1 Tax=Ferruginibacter yonginensis TaxID=1310416 RepID=A0ABV8QTH0_9BACT
MKKILFFLSFLLLNTLLVFAQPNKVTADKIVGIIGNKIVLKSDITDRLLDMQRQGAEIPENGQCLVFQDLMGTKTLVLQAEKDSLPVTDEEVETDIDNRIRTYINQFGGKNELEKVAGKTIYQLKEDMRDPIKDQKLAAAMRNKIVDAVRITPTEVRNYFVKIPTDSLPYYESEVEIGQLIVFPKASRDAEEYCKEQLNEYKAAIESGKKDFKQAAAQYSDEPGAKERFGQMEINRNQKDIDPTFLSKCFTLKEGQISNPFKSKFGYHIIQLVSRNGEDVVVRHIIKIPQVTTIELKEGLDKLDSVRAKLIAGTIDFGTAINKYSDDDNSKFTAGMMQGPGGTFLTIDQLDKDIIPILKTLKPGAYSQPQAFTDPSGKQGVRIIYLKTQTAPHRENLRDDYNKIAQRALEEKKENAIEAWFNKKLSSYYIMIDPEFKDCDALKPWVDVANKRAGK